MFAHKHLLQIEAPLWQAQLLETYLLNTFNYPSLIATKAARIHNVVGENALLLEFGPRQTFSLQGSVWAARAASARGGDVTSNMLVALKLGYNLSRTRAHFLVMPIRAVSQNS